MTETLWMIRPADEELDPDDFYDDRMVIDLGDKSIVVSKEDEISLIIAEAEAQLGGKHDETEVIVDEQSVETFGPYEPFEIEWGGDGIPVEREGAGDETEGVVDDNAEETEEAGDDLDAETEGKGDDNAEDSDYIEDDNKIQAQDVDMKDFRDAIAEWNKLLQVGNDADFEETLNVDLENFDSDTENEEDVLPINASLKELRKKAKLGNTTDPFYVGQLIDDKEEIKTIVKEHALESRRQLYFQKNEYFRIRVVCRGTKKKFKDGECSNTSRLHQKRKSSTTTNTSGPRKRSSKVPSSCHVFKPSYTSGQASKFKPPRKNNPTPTCPPSTVQSHDSTSVQQTPKDKPPRKKYPKPTCPWTLHISRKATSDPWCVKTFIKKHNCHHTREVNLYTMGFIADEIVPLVRGNPTIPLQALKDLLEKKHQIHISIMKVARAKAIACRKFFGDYQEQYGLLREYCEELLRSNPGSTVKLDVQPEPNLDTPTRTFKRVYICFGALKRGFRMCGRELLGLDGCFMKGPYPGQILTAVGVDANNGIYPVAYALVEAETRDSWAWFLECLGDDLGISSSSNFTFISDRQKGLIPAVSTLFPNAEHRFCVRHILQNMKLRWRGGVYKSMFLGCAHATTVALFDRKMEAIRQTDPTLYSWLKAIPPSSWSRAHFTGRAKCDVLLNNLCETFNKQLVGARDKPVITCLEFIRQYMTKRIMSVNKAIKKEIHDQTGPLTPYATLVFDVIKEEASKYNVLLAGFHKFEVSMPGSDQRVVNLDEKTCTCRKWELTGIPCKHAVACIWDMEKNNIEVDIPEKWVSEVYWLSTWEKVYLNTLEPVSGPEDWVPSPCPTKLTAPRHHVQPGRPKKQRTKSILEKEDLVSSDGKLTRKGGTTQCGKCKNYGHNARSCKGQGGEGSQAASQSAPQASQD